MRSVCGLPACSKHITTPKYNPSSLLLTTSNLKESYLGKDHMPEKYRVLKASDIFSFFPVFLHHQNKLSYTSWSHWAVCFKFETMPVLSPEERISLLFGGFYISQICSHERDSLTTSSRFCCCKWFVWFWALKLSYPLNICLFVHSNKSWLSGFDLICLQSDSLVRRLVQLLLQH